MYLNGGVWVSVRVPVGFFCFVFGFRLSGRVPPRKIHKRCSKIGNSRRCHKLYGIFKSNSFHQPGHVLSTKSSKNHVIKAKVKPNIHAYIQTPIYTWNYDSIRTAFNFSHDKFIEIWATKNRNKNRNAIHKRAQVYKTPQMLCMFVCVFVCWRSSICFCYVFIMPIARSCSSGSARVYSPGIVLAINLCAVAEKEDVSAEEGAVWAASV